MLTLVGREPVFEHYDAHLYIHITILVLKHISDVIYGQFHPHLVNFRSCAICRYEINSIAEMGSNNW